MKIKNFIYLLLASMLVLSSCGGEKRESIIVYTALDQIFSEPILKEFEQKTGIKVKAVYDTEVTKTIGLVNRLLAEKDNPQCDVFWNNEVSRTIMLDKKGLLDKFIPKNASDIPQEFKGKNGTWVGFAARARVIIYNKNLVKEDELPKSIYDFADPKWKGKCAIANPLFGTTAAQAAALFAYLGDKKAKEYFNSLKKNNVIIVDGNAMVRDVVAGGEIAFGMTDTDDANGAIEDGKPVGMIFPDADGMGTLFIPNTLSLIKNSPHPDAAKKLIEYLLSPEVEIKLAQSRSAQIPLNKKVEISSKIPQLKDAKFMKIDYEVIADKIEKSTIFIKEHFIN